MVNSGPPVFMEEIQKEINVINGQKVEIKFPIIEDPDNDEYVILVKIKEAI